MLFSLGYEGTGKTPEPEVGGPEVVKARVRNDAQDGKCRDRLPKTETGSRATGTGSSATDDVSSVILGKLFFNPTFSLLRRNCRFRVMS